MSAHQSRRAAAALAAAVCIVPVLTGTSIALADDTWVSSTSGNWSEGGRWQDGTAPTSPVGKLTFNGIFGINGYTATHNLGPNFAVDELDFVGQGSQITQLAASGGSSITDLHFVKQLGLNPITLNLPVNLTGNAAFSVGPDGLGDITVFSNLSGNGSISLAPGAPPYAGAARVILNGNNSYTGGTTVNEGLLGIGSSTALGTGTLSCPSNGEVYAIGAQTINNNVTNTLQVTGGDNLTVNGNISSGGVILQSSTNPVTLTLTAANSYTATTLIDLPRFIDGKTLSSPGTIVFSGASGAAANSGLLIVKANGSVVFDNTAGVANRFKDNANVRLANGNLTVIGNNAATTVEIVGPVSVEGFNTVTVTPGSSADVGFAGSSITRVDHGMLFVRGTNLGQTAGNVSKVDFSTSPTGDLVGGHGAAGSTNISILPYVVGTNSGTGSEPDRPVTIGVSGLRPLTTAEMHNGIESAGNLDNVIVTDQTPVQVLPYTKTINSIYAVPQGANPSINVATDNATISDVKSGLVMTSGLISLRGTWNFAGHEANFVTSPGLTTFSSLPTNIVNLTKSGQGNLQFPNNPMNVDNSVPKVTGQVTINQGLLWLGDPRAVAGVSNYVIKGAPPTIAQFTQNGLFWTGIGTGTLSAPISIDVGFGSLSTSGPTLFVNSTVSGEGGVLIANTHGETTVLGASNDYELGTRIVQGALQISSDANLGAAGGMVDISCPNIADSTLRLGGNWTSSRQINVSGETGSGKNFFDTNGFDATWNGPLTTTFNPLQNRPFLTRIGTGTWTLNHDSNYTGIVNLNAGLTRLAAQMPAADFNVNDGGSLAGTGSTKSITIAGGSTGGTLQPGLGIGSISTTSLSLQGNGNIEWQLRDASGNAGTGYDFIQDSGAYDQNSANGFKIKLQTVADSGGTPGLATNFDPNQPYSWTLINSPFFIFGFDASKFTIDPTGFANPTNGTFSVALGFGQVQIHYTPVPEPGTFGVMTLVAGAATLRRRRRAE